MTTSCCIERHRGQPPTIVCVGGDATQSEIRGRELAGLLAAGDPDAIGQLYRAYGRLVFSIALKILGDHGHAEEATQTAFTKLWQARERVDAGRDVRPLLFTVTRRVAYDMRERSVRRPWTALDERVAEPSVEDGIDRMLTAWQVREALDVLPDDERQIVRMQHLDGLTHSEIAERLDMPVGTVKSRSFRAHRKLILHLKPLREEV